MSVHTQGLIGRGTEDWDMDEERNALAGVVEMSVVSGQPLHPGLHN